MAANDDARISEDLRYELADAARVAETGNKPRGLLVVATLLFLVAGIALVVTLRQRESAAKQFRVQSDYETRLDNLEVQFQTVESLRGSGRAEGSEHLNDLYTRIERAAETAGLVNKPAIPPPSSSASRGAIKYQYVYKMQDPNLQNLLAWVEEARAKVPGLEVASLEIVPTAKQWKFDITFVRWERPS
jgi:hypothetical protein